MDNSQKHLVNIGKMLLWLGGTFIAGIIGSIAFSLMGWLLETAFTFNPDMILPTTIGYALGFLLGIPIGNYLLGNLIYHRKGKLWMLFVGTILGFAIFLVYYWISAPDNVIPLVFFTLFHAGPWVLTSLVGLIFLPKAKAQNPEIIG